VTALALGFLWQNGCIEQLAANRPSYTAGRIRESDCIAWLAHPANQEIILSMAANPHPHDLTCALSGERSMMEPHSHRP
jgi:hypothetical protein